MNTRNIGKLLVAGGVAVAAAGCATTGIESRLIDTHSASFLTEKVEAAEVKDAKIEAKKVLEDYTRDYESHIKADSAINVEGDLEMLAGYRQRVAALAASPVVQKDAEAVAMLNQVAQSVGGLKSVFDKAIAESGYAKIFVDAVIKADGSRVNFGGTKKAGGYVVQASLEQIGYAVAASEVAPENASAEELTAIIAKMKGGNAEYAAKPDVKAALKYAGSVVDELKKEAVTEEVLAMRDVERRNSVSTQVSYKALRALVHLYSGNGMMKASIDGLSPTGTGPMMVCNEGCNVQYVAGNAVKLTEVLVGQYNPSQYAVAVAPVAAPAAEKKAAEPVAKAK